MEKIIDLIKKEFEKVFSELKLDKNYIDVKLSDRPDLCMYQSTSALKITRTLKKNPIDVAESIAKLLGKSKQIFDSVEVVKPGFINMNISYNFLSNYLTKMVVSKDLGFEQDKNPKKIIIDYGGANVAKALHVGHIRSAIIGESIKRMLSFAGHHCVGDVHLGDFGLQMGLIICELELMYPDLVYFNEYYINYYANDDRYKPTFTILDLEEIYPRASKRAKEDEEFREKARRVTKELQQGNIAYRDLWNYILEVSVKDLKKNYERLNVSFELWKGESDSLPYIEDMVRKMRESGIAYESDGALVIDVQESSDNTDIPPCMVLKSDSSYLYQTTDLATLVERAKLFDPDEVIYIVDKRQSLHFKQVFRAAKKANIVRNDTNLEFIGFGTMNGKDGKPYKTREGSVMRLETLIDQVESNVCKILEEHDNNLTESQFTEATKLVALSALKYGDLSNIISKDYIFDLERFISFEGNTGPYLLYTIVRIKSILEKVPEIKNYKIGEPTTDVQLELMVALSKFNYVVSNACSEKAPHRLCNYAYEIANIFNKFYHETNVIKEPDVRKKKNLISILMLTKRVLEQLIYLLGFDAPSKM